MIYINRGILLFFICYMVVSTTYAKSSKEAEKLEESDTVTLSVYFADPNPNWNNMLDDVGQVITAKTGVKLDVDMAVGDAEKEINLIATSGVYPDLISPKGMSGELIAAGALLDLTYLIENYAPNIRRVLGDQIKRLRHNCTDQSIYFIPTFDAINQHYYRVGGPFNLQLDVVKELGYPRIRTLKDYEDVIKRYIEMYPTIDGKETIGLSLLADDWRFLISTSNPAFFATGAPDDGEFYIDPETYEVTLHYRRPAEREYFRWLNHMNDIGLLDPESFVQKYDQYITKISSGRVLAVIDQDWEIAQAVNSLKADGKFSRVYGTFPVTLDESYKIPVFQQTGFNGGWGIAITKDCKDPVAAIKMLDFLASEEGQILLNWGVEGKHYNYIDGKRVIPDDVMFQKVNNNNRFKRETGIGNYQLSVRYGDGNIDSTGNYYTTTNPEHIIKDYSDFEREVLKGYGINFWKDLFPRESEFQLKSWGSAWNIPIPTDSPITIFLEKEQEIIHLMIPLAILAEPSEFDAVYDDMLEQLETIGVREIEKEYSTYVKKRITLWNE